jgi:dTDP-4-amino-4,6-dideoxygalactose transaminase
MNPKQVGGQFMKTSGRETHLPFALPDIDETEIALVSEALRSGWVTTGPQVRRFETEFATAVGGRYAVAVNSCTAAMHLALEAIGLQPNEEVITTPYTFAATAEVIRYFGARPVLVDIRADDFNIDPALIEQAVTERTRAILPVHIAGLPADLDAIGDIATRHHLAVIEDAAHAFPTRYQDRLIGQDAHEPGPARIVCFSFYATKTITTGEGGMLVTDDEAMAERCRVMSLHGISKDAWKRYTKEGSWYYEIIAPGFKYNMTDVAAAMGIAQLAKSERMWRRRREIARAYSAAFSQAPELQTPVDGTDDQHAWHLYMLRLQPSRLQIDRNAFIEELKLRKIGVSVHFIPLHLHPYYRESYGLRPEDYPVAYREFSREISLPVYSKMSDQDVQDVIDAVLEIVCQHRC